MWSEMARIIGEVRPRFAFIENSPALVNRGLDTVLADLAAMGFDAEWGVLSAADVGAPHIRERIWILAHARQVGRPGPIRLRDDGEERKRRVQTIRGKNWIATDVGQEVVAFRERWPDQPDPPSMVNGMASWLDELSATGNGQVPRVAATAFRLLAARAGVE